MRRPQVLAGLALAAIATATGCGGGDGTGPGGSDGEHTLLGNAPLSGTVGGASNSVVRARYQPASGLPYEVWFSADDPSVGLYRIGAGGDTTALVAPGTGPRDTTTRRVRAVADLLAPPLELLVAARNGGGGGFRLTAVPQRRGPESHGVRVTLDEVVEERFDSPIDADVFEFQGTAGTSVVLFVQLLDPVPAGTSYRAYVRYAGALDPSAGVSSTLLASPDSSLESSAAFRMELRDSLYQLVIDRGFYLDGSTATPRYRAVLRRVNPAPEDRSASLTPGDTIASAIEYYGDFDDYTLVGTPGDTVIVFAQATGATGGIVAHLPAYPVHDPSGAIAAAGSPLLATPSYPFAIPASGQLAIRVEAAAENPFGRTRGGYRLFAYRLDSLPEGRAAAIAANEVVTGTIGLAGDADVYQLVLGAPSTVNLMLERPSAAGSDTLVATIRRAGATLARVRLPEDIVLDPLRRGSGRLALAAGTYSVGVRATSTRGDGYRGAYALRVARIDSLPESRPAAITIGEAFASEAIDVPGDLDVFTFTGTAADSIAVRFTPAVPSSPWQLTVRDVSSGATIGTASVASAAGLMTGVVPLGHAGTFALRVSGMTEGRDVTEAGGPYRIETFPMSSGPESRSATIVVGDTVRGERIDHPGDVDTFVLTAPAGREIIVTLHGTRDSIGHAFELRVLNPANGLSLGETASVGAPHASARISVPPGAPLRLAIAENTTLCGQPPCAEGATLTGSYWFSTHVFDPAPEGRAASFAIGDTLDERIDPVGDVDEYEFTGSAGEQLLLQFATPDGVSTSGGCAQGLTAVVRSKATFQALRVANSQTPGTLDASSLAFTLPSAGAYTLTVSEVQGARCVTGHYLARVARQP